MTAEQFDELTFQIQGCVRCGEYLAAAKVARRLVKELEAKHAHFEALDAKDDRLRKESACL